MYVTVLAKSVCLVDQVCLHLYKANKASVFIHCYACSYTEAGTIVYLILAHNYTLTFHFSGKL